MLHKTLPIDLISWVFLFVGKKGGLKFEFCKSLFLGLGIFLKETDLKERKLV